MLASSLAVFADDYCFRGGGVMVTRLSVLVSLLYQEPREAIKVKARGWRDVPGITSEPAEPEPRDTTHWQL